jgi:hypothetical protein
MYGCENEWFSYSQKVRPADLNDITPLLTLPSMLPFYTAVDDYMQHIKKIIHAHFVKKTSRMLRYTDCSSCSPHLLFFPCVMTDETTGLPIAIE